jgi:hypothetical protein
MNILRVHADESGETHLTRIELPDAARTDDGMGSPLRRVLGEIPTTTMSINENLERRPKMDLHPAPRRQLVILLRGGFEIVTTTGESHRFEPGECLLADDVGYVGHYHEDCGDEPTITITVGIPDDWVVPGA